MLINLLSAQILVRNLNIGPARDGAISGTVTNADGEPLNGIMVAAHSGNASGAATTSDSGAYRIEGLGSAAQWMMEVFSTSSYCGQMRDQVAVNSENVDFVLGRWNQIAGIVHDAETNAPISEFEVRIQNGTWNRYLSADGRFLINAWPAGETILEVRAHGYQPATKGPVSVGAEPVQVALIPGSTLSGLVIAGATGEPVSGARVRVHAEDDSIFWLARGVGWSELDPSTDEAGRFVLRGVPTEGRASIVAWKPGYVVSLVQASAEGEVVVAISAGGGVEGTATKGGQPAADVHIELLRDSTADDLDYKANAVTSTTGHFLIKPLPAGTYQISCRDSVSLNANLLWQNQIQIEDGHTTQVDISLTRH